MPSGGSDEAPAVFPALPFWCRALRPDIHPNSRPTAPPFKKQAEARLARLSVKVNTAAWVQENFITFDTQALNADMQDINTAATTELVEQAKRFDGLRLPPSFGPEIHVVAFVPDSSSPQRTQRSAKK